MINSDYQLLAGVTVFRELYDTQKDIYDVLCVFIKHTLFTEKLFTFTADDLTNILNEKYHFGLKKAVVKSALNRFNFPKQDNVYTNNLVKEDISITELLDDSQENANNLFKELFAYVEEKNKITLSDKDKNDLSIYFTDYLLDNNTESKYTSVINMFLLSIENNKMLMDCVTKIKEGNLLYEGIRYCGNPAEIGSWTTELNIYLDTEILFSYAGYNGELYKSNVSEFFEYVTEINKNKAKSAGRIYLWYFSEVKEEIDTFFNTAEKIVKREFDADPSNIAMNNIINGCESASDVKDKYTKLIELLKKNHINIYNTSEMYEESNQRYNLLSSTLLGELSNKSINDNERIYKSVAKINYINILRKDENNKGFENIGHILLTATGVTLKIANSTTFKINHDVPKATYTDFLINRFWYKLNKGFGTNKTPKTIDVITKSRILLSSLINTQVSQKYDSVKECYKNGELEKERACLLISELHELAQLPENVEIQDIEDTINAITRWDIQTAIDTNQLKACEAIKFKEENEELREIQKRQTEEINKYREAETRRINFKNKTKKILKLSYLIFISLMIIVCVVIDAYFYAQGNKLAITISTAIGLFAIVPGIISGLKFLINKRKRN